MAAELMREIIFRPAFDCMRIQPCVHGSDTCKPGTGGSHGRHGVDMIWFLKGPDRAVQFAVFTMWHLDVTYESLPLDPLFYKPMPSDLGYHSPYPMWDGDTPLTDECEWTGGAPCFYDGSGLNADEPFRILRERGSDAVWAFLEEYYAETFSPAVPR